MSRPTPEQTAEARAWFTENQLAALRLDGFENTAKMVAILLAATKPPTDEEITERVNEYMQSGDKLRRLHPADFVKLGVRAFLGEPEEQ